MILETLTIIGTIGLIKKEVSFKIRMASLKRKKTERLLAIEQSLQEEQRQRDAKINAFLLRK